MTAPLYGDPKVRKQPLRPSLQSPVLAPGRAMEQAGRTAHAAGNRWQNLLEDAEKEKQATEINNLVSGMMNEWNTTHLPEYKLREGNLAIGVVDEASKRLEEMGRDRLQGLSPWAAKRASTRWRNFTQSELSGLADIEARERVKAKIASQGLFVDQWVESLSNNPTIENYERGVSEIGAMLTQELDDDESVADHPLILKGMMGAKERLAVSQIGSLIHRGDLKKAEFFIELHSAAPEGQRGTLSKPNELALRKVLKAKKVEIDDDLELIEDQEDADAMIDKALKENLTSAEVEDLARKKWKGKKEERMILKLRDRLRSVEEGKAAADRKAVDDATAKVNELIPLGPPIEGVSEQETKLNELMKGVPEKYHARMHTYIHNRRMNDPVTAATTAARNEWYEMTPDQKLSMTPEQFHDKFYLRMNERDYAHAEREFHAMRDSRTGMTARSWDNRRKTFIDKNIEITDTSGEAKLQRVILKEALDIEYERQVNEKGAPLTGPEQDKLINAYSETAVVGTKWVFWDHTMQRWEAVVHPEDSVRARWRESALRDVSTQQARDAISQALEADPAMRVWRDDFIKRYTANYGSEPSQKIIVDAAIKVRQSGEIPQ